MSSEMTKVKYDNLDKVKAFFPDYGDKGFIKPILSKEDI